MVVRRDAELVRQLHHPGPLTNGCDDRCLQLRLGRVVATIRPDRQHSPRNTGLVAPARAGHVEQCERALWSSSYSAGSSALASRQASACGDGQQGHPDLCESPRRSVLLPQQCRPSPVDNVLQQQHPVHCSAPSRQGQSEGRCLIEMAEGSLRNSAPSRLVSKGS